MIGHRLNDTQKLNDIIDKAVESLSDQMVSRYQALVVAQGDRPVGQRKRTGAELASEMLPQWAAYAPAMTPEGEQWREQFIAQHGPDQLLAFDKKMQKLYTDPRTSLEATMNLRPQEVGHMLSARDSGLYQQAPAVAGTNGSVSYGTEG